MHEHDQHVSPIKNWKQLVVVIALALIVPITIIVLLSQYVTGGSKGVTEDDSAILNRIKPVGDVRLAIAGAAPAAAVATAATAPASAGKPDGKKVYDTTCVACHATGVANAPKLGDKAAWVPRLKTGMDALYASVLKGKNAMPAKGGNAALADADAKAAVDYMTAAAR